MAKTKSDLEGVTVDDLAQIEGTEVERDENGEIRLVRMPSPYTQEKPHPAQILGYEAKIDRAGTARRVASFVTDEVDLTAEGVEGDLNVSRYLVRKEHFGPRNTVEAIAFAMARDDNTPGIERDLAKAKEQVRGYLDQLVELGFVEQRASGAYKLTAAGRLELSN